MQAVYEHSIRKLFTCLQPSTCDWCTTRELLCWVQMVVSSRRCFACVECHQAKVRCSLLADLPRSKRMISRGRTKAREASVRSKNGDEGQSTGSPQPNAAICHQDEQNRGRQPAAEQLW